MKTLQNCSAALLMRNAFTSVILVGLLLFNSSIESHAQCVAPPVQPSCASGIALVDNDNLTLGVTKVVSGTSSFSGLTINGGTLIVCGTLNLTSLTFTSGTIYVCSGATLNVNTAAAVVFGNNCNLYNFGTTYFASSIVTGANNLIVNCTTSSYFNIPFNQFVLQGPNTQFVNYGIFNSSYFIVQSTNSPNPVCSGLGSVIITGIMINQYANAFTSPSGPSCIQITNQAINSQPMTATANVQICYYGASASGLNFGNATVSLNCNSCSVVLPVDVIQLAAACLNSNVTLNWVVQSEDNCSDYDVQISSNGVDFQNVRQIQCNGPSATELSYSCSIEIAPLGAHYIRVKRSDFDGNEDYSSTVILNCLEGSTVDIFPTYVEGTQITVTSDDRIVAINMYTMDGRKVKSFDLEPNQKVIVLDIGSDTALGEYFLVVETPAARIDKLIHVAH